MGEMLSADSLQVSAPLGLASAGKNCFSPDHTLPGAVRIQPSKPCVQMSGHFIPIWTILLPPHSFHILHPNSISGSASGESNPWQRLKLYVWQLSSSICYIKLMNILFQLQTKKVTSSFISVHNFLCYYIQHFTLFTSFWSKFLKNSRN